MQKWEKYATVCVKKNKKRMVYFYTYIPGYAQNIFGRTLKKCVSEVASEEGISRGG